MGDIKITQEHIDKYVASTEDFWKEFQQSLSAPYSFWNEWKELTVKLWINVSRNDKEMIPYLDLLFQHPVLKGEYPIGFGSGMILTNYRLLINDDSSISPNIPLNKLNRYTESGNINYEKNGEILKLEYEYIIKTKIVNSAKSRNKTKKLSQEQLFILENSMFEITRQNPELNIPTVQIPDEQDTSINFKEPLEILTQEQTSKFIVETESFWKDFYKSLSSSFSPWNEHKDVTFDKWVIMCWSNKEMRNYLSILFQYPLLKGEYIVAYAGGMILTNYRLVINDKSNNIPSIPLTRIKKYTLDGGGIIKIENHDELHIIIYEKLKIGTVMIDEKYITGAISRCKKEGLDEIQEKLITNSLDELKKDFSELSVPKVEMYPLSEKQKVEIQKSDKSEKRKGVMGKVIKGVLGWGVVIYVAYLIISFFMSMGECNLDGCHRESKGWYSYKSMPDHNEEFPMSRGHSVFKVRDWGGSCSKDHAMRHLNGN